MSITLSAEVPMKSLWGKIGFGALGVFLVGMLVVTLAGQAKSAAVSALSSLGEFRGTGHAPSRLPFRLNGEAVGLIRRLTVAREARGELPRVDLEVELTREQARSRLDRCDLIAAGRDDYDFERGFRCLRPGTPGYLYIGEAHFSPGEFSRQLRVAERLESELRGGDPFQATAEMGGDVRVTARGADGKLVRVAADSTGANIRINDAMGRSILRLLADSNGALLRIRGKDGRDIVRLDAGGGAFSLSIDTAGVH
jgi:hypothetical protein